MVVFGMAVAFVELAYTLDRNDDPSIFEVLGYIVGARRHLDAVHEVTSHLAEVIEIETWRPSRDVHGAPAAASDPAESAKPSVAEAAAGQEKADVVLAIPEDNPR